MPGSDAVARTVYPKDVEIDGQDATMEQPPRAGHNLPADAGAHRDLESFTAAFVTNSRGIAPVGQIDDHIVPVHATLIKTLTQAYESAGWDRI